VAHVLIAGESWITHSIHIKGFDTFTQSGYAEGVGFLRDALLAAGHEVTFLPNHLANAAFPTSADALRAFDVVMLSDIGANTLLLHPDTFNHSKPMANRLHLIRDYVRDGGALVMIGGYLTFQGIDAKGRYAGTAVEEALPVALLPQDDRVEAPQGARPMVLKPEHPVMAGLDGEWPSVLGYNRVVPKSGAELLATADEDPLVVVWPFGRGRSMAFTTDCGPHWAPPPFVEWPGYARFWSNAVAWLTAPSRGRRGPE
jgi:uncharacterized membrane protein